LSPDPFSTTYCRAPRGGIWRRSFERVRLELENREEVSLYNNGWYDWTSLQVYESPWV